MSKDILTFTKDLSGIDIVDYVVNYIDQNMIAYRILKNLNHNITTSELGTSLVYNIDGLSENEMIEIRRFPAQQDIAIYNSNYTVIFNIPDNSRFEIIIKRAE